jgi:hypothetical protein
MKYAWKVTGRNEWDETHTLYLILDKKKYPFAEIVRHDSFGKYSLWVNGWVSEETLDIERARYNELKDAKDTAFTYMQVWWVSGAFQRMNDEERKHWQST